MKKLLSVAVILLCVCVSYAQSPIKQYLEDQHPNATSLTIVSEGPIDSLYSPYNTYFSAAYFFGKRATQLLTANDEAYNATSRDASIRTLKEALDAGIKDYQELAAAITKANTLAPQHFESPSKNRIGQIATYMLNGVEKTDVFIYNMDGKTIGHTSTQNIEYLNQSNKAQELCIEALKETGKELEKILSGESRYTAWQ